MKKYIQQLIAGENLTASQSYQAMQTICSEAEDCQIAAFLVLLSAKGETSEEIMGVVRALQEKMQIVPTSYAVLDIVGTGGDGANTVNISTAASILAASCGVKVAKHGGQAVSSACGSANVLEKLGILLDLTPQQVAASIDEVGIGFCFAPYFHPALAKVKKIRDSLGVRTIFNLVGPLLNPARAKYILLGVFRESLLSIMAHVLAQLPIQRAMVVHSQGLDELSLLGTSKIFEIHQGKIETKILDPKSYGFHYGELKDIQGGDANYNAKLLLEVFAGKRGLLTDTIILNAGVGLYVAEQVTTIADGIAWAREQLYAGKALTLLEKWIDYCRKQKYA